MMKNTEPKELVLFLYKEVIGNRKAEWIDSLIHENYIQHSPMVKDGREGFKEAIAFLKQMPEPQEKKSPIILAIAEGDLVFLHMQLEMMGRKLGIMEIFRIKEGKIAEHWDATTTLENFWEFEEKLVLKNRDQGAVNKELVSRLLSEQQGADKLSEMDADLYDASLHTLGKSSFPFRKKVHRLIAEGNFVAAQSEGEKEGKAYVFYDLFQVENGKIIKHWLVEQAVPEKMMHTNGML